MKCDVIIDRLTLKYFVQALSTVYSTESKALIPNTWQPSANTLPSIAVIPMWCSRCHT